jgi:putative phosphoribosyl transferase
MVKKEIDLLIEPGLKGELEIPHGAKGLVIIAHSSGSGRYNDRHKTLASHLNLKGLGTFHVDLLTPEEECIDNLTREFQFKLSLLTERLLYAIRWVQQNDETKDLNIGLFGFNTGSAVALSAAAVVPDAIKAVVSRSGRPELAELSLPDIYAATLFIVGEKDMLLMQLNQFAYDTIKTLHKNMQIIPEMSDFIGEPYALKLVEELSGRWFANYLIAGDEDL